MSKMSLQNTQITVQPPTPRHHSGFKRDPPDSRDLSKVYGTSEIPSTDDHPVADLRKYINQIYIQGTLGSCTACVVCAAYKLELSRQAEEKNRTYYYQDVSCLFVYYNARDIYNDTDSDGGACFRETLKAIHDKGVCRESLWPYDMEKFADKPPPVCYDDAEGNTVCKYATLKQGMDQFRACLKSGFPFAFGFLAYDSFDDISSDGIMPIPSDEEIQSNPEPTGHGVLAVGYDDNTQHITVLNSWGHRFGDNGYFYMPYELITDPNFAFDFWKIEEACEKYEIVVQTLPY